MDIKMLKNITKKHLKNKTMERSDSESEMPLVLIILIWIMFIFFIGTILFSVI